MSLTTKMQEQGGNPSGLLGRLIGKAMNLSHGHIHEWGLDNCSIRETDHCLDIGCGGGKAVKSMAGKAIKGKIYGLDHSMDMVNLARKLNRVLVARGLVAIDQGSVSALPYANNQFDLVTAFETIQFWPDFDKDLKEVKRVLKPTGTFLIVNRYPPENSKWSEFLQIKNASAYTRVLSSAGFAQTSIDHQTKKGWICILSGIENEF